MWGGGRLNNCMETKINGPEFDHFTTDAAIYHWLNDRKGPKHLDGHKTSNI